MAAASRRRPWLERLAPVLLLLPTHLLADEENPVVVPPPRAIPAIALLPVGSVLNHVMLPRYDRDRKLTGVLKSAEMTLVTADQILAKTVSFQFFNPDRTQRGRMDLGQALFDQKKSLLRANEAVHIISDRVTAEGSGLVYAFDQSKGFLAGPATTRIIKPPAIAMKSAKPALLATALLGTSPLPLTAAPLAAAAPPAVLTAEELAAIQEQSISKSAEVTAANATVRADLRASLTASNEANQAATAFLEQADLLAAAEEAAELALEPKPLEVQPDADTTVINSQGGMYFDDLNGVFIFLKKITVADPRFDLDGANELKIFFDKKEPATREPEDALEDADAEKPGKKNSFSFGGGNIGDPRKVVATGAVHILQKGVDGKEPVEASGAVFTYDLVTGDMILSGGYPWVRQGTTFSRAKEPNLILRIDKNFKFVTKGNWELGLKLNQQR